MKILCKKYMKRLPNVEIEWDGIAACLEDMCPCLEHPSNSKSTWSYWCSERERNEGIWWFYYKVDHRYDSTLSKKDVSQNVWRKRNLMPVQV